MGQVIPATAGLRKIRWYSVGKGKRGGLRIIYYWFQAGKIILLLLPYKKAFKEDLTKHEIKLLMKAVKEHLYEKKGF